MTAWTALFAQRQSAVTKKIVVFTTIVSTLFCGLNIAQAADEEKSEAPPATVTRATSLITRDLDKSIAFYTEFLGYTVANQLSIDSANAKAGMGLDNSDDIEFVVLAAPNRSEENKDYSGLNLIGGADVDASPFSQDAGRPSTAGQLLFSFQVKNLREIARRMREAGVTIIAGPVLSSTGKSITMTIFDPNGVRIDMYEYVDTPNK